ncbi:MAG: hypothetical protein HKO92_11865 [Flavobacteriaceae bacterium]|nr:hypothetical protein [Bacteroidia bacterium]NNK83812.1 hypothetical protein [Flavobacteriaceae bacterium]
MSRILNIVLIIIGGTVAIYAEADESQNLYILIGGLFILMVGLYRLSRQIPDKKPKDEFIKEEDDV